MEADPLPGQQHGREGLKQVISVCTAFRDIHLGDRRDGGEKETRYLAALRGAALIAANSLVFQPPASR